MVIESTKVHVQASPATVTAFLSNAENIIHLLPQDQITDWKATPSECSFKVQGGVLISLVQNGTDGEDKIRLKSGAKSPFPFQLTLHVIAKGEETEGYIVFDGEVNAFLKMLVQKPLTALFEMMSQNLMLHFKA
jgi:carbon monoxide dehydrogenase subunit G